MDIIEHVKKCIARAEAEEQSLPSEILQYPGYSGTKTRHFYNAICSIPKCSYLEIGTWYGSSSISALYGNTVNATFIDNWSEFNGNKDILINALERFKGQSSYTLIESDAWKVDHSTLGMFDVYLYDGGHSYSDHYNAISHYKQHFKNNCIVMIDDWDWPDIQNGTLDAIRDNNLNVSFSHKIVLPYEDIVGMPDHIGKHTWWNGIGIFVISDSN